jgi:phosphoglycolate phosphatase
MRYTAALFDMDGTVLDTLEDLHLALDHALKSQGLPTRSLEECRRFVGNGIANLVRRGVPEGTDETTTQAAFEEFNRWYKVHCADHTHPYPGIVELLRDLSEAGVPTAVVSNKSDYAVQELASQYFPGLLATSMGVHEGCPKKPDPTMCQAVMGAMGANPISTCYIGDSEVDVATAANAGLPGIICLWGFRTREELGSTGATTFVEDVDGLRRMLLG